MATPAPPRNGKNGQRSITLADVAALAGVSKITASRALSNPALVTTKTQEAVRKAVAEIGYIPNLMAGGLRSKRSRLIACLVPTIASGSAFLDSVHGMTEAFAAAGYQVMLGERGYDESRDDEMLEAVIARRPDGIVLTGMLQSPTARARLQHSRIPVVETWELGAKPVDMLVGFSHEKVGEAVAEYFFRRGRRRPALITSSVPRGQARAMGFANAATRLGMLTSASALPTWPVATPTRVAHGRQGLKELLRLHPTIDCLYCSMDTIALGALLEAQAQNIAVPGQLAIIGFGDLDFAPDTTPPLTTVNINGAQIGTRAAEMLLARIEGRRVTRRVVDLGFSLIERGSA